MFGQTLSSTDGSRGTSSMGAELPCPASASASLFCGASSPAPSVGGCKYERSSRVVPIRPNTLMASAGEDLFLFHESGAWRGGQDIRPDISDVNGVGKSDGGMPSENGDCDKARKCSSKPGGLLCDRARKCSSKPGGLLCDRARKCSSRPGGLFPIKSRRPTGFSSSNSGRLVMTDFSLGWNTRVRAPAKSER